MSYCMPSFKTKVDILLSSVFYLNTSVKEQKCLFRGVQQKCSYYMSETEEICEVQNGF